MHPSEQPSAQAPAQTWIMHVDMDAFFASVEQLDDPSLRGKPVAVGGDSDRGVVAAASYEARTFKVRSAMSMVMAKRLCPQLIVVPGRMRRYSEISHQVMDVLRRFSPLVEQASVDEAYLDVTGTERLFGPPEELGAAVKGGVRARTGLNCSVGIAPVRFLAKIASDFNKPDGLTVVHPEQVRAFLAQLPVEKIPGAGKRTLDGLARLGVRMAADVLRYPESFWAQRLGKWGPALYDRARGVDPRGVIPESEPKSSSAENTFREDTHDRTILRTWLLRQADRVAADLRRHGVKGRTVTLKIKYSDFRQITRSRTLDEPICDTETIHRTAVALLEELRPSQNIRLIGVGVSNFHSRPRQLSLLEEPKQVSGTRRLELERAVDAVRERFGKESLTRGDLLDFDGKRGEKK